MPEPTGVLSDLLGILTNGLALYRRTAEKTEKLATAAVVPEQERELKAQTRIQAFSLIFEPIVAFWLQRWRTTVVTSLAVAPVMLGLSLICWAAIKISGTPATGVALLKVSWWLWIVGGLIQVLALNYESTKDSEFSAAALEEVAEKLARSLGEDAETEVWKKKQNLAQQASARALIVRGLGFALVLFGVILFGLFISMNA